MRVVRHLARIIAPSTAARRAAAAAAAAPVARPSPRYVLFNLLLVAAVRFLVERLLLVVDQILFLVRHGGSGDKKKGMRVSACVCGSPST
jgi:hypothetical protein